ncbi:helix-turn-helix domain-containing protein [Marinomonas pollencensis]|uniref:AraC family transcriptional regulator n=1 Tax=Marinomonas pollencensis TaxID=491954 RepID=A0A3E0DSC4_9GAMM|nr:AraC family transcriptional regulator [Marinomonas pollencensis]REG86447.1 AraC family transcriptional regulator [Marinomonas pollencensis]
MRDTIEIIAYQDTAKPHQHNHTQIVLPLEGSLYLDVENSQRLVTPGQACMISTEHSHAHLAKQDNRCLVINHLACWNKDISSTDAFITLSPQAQAYLPFLSSMVEHNTNPVAQAHALQLVEFLLPIPKEVIYQSDKRIEQAKQHFDENYRAPYAVEELAEKVHLSHSQLTILFKRHLGMTPKQYLIKCRLEQAKKQLTTTTKGLEDIAFSVGLHDASALSRLFAKHMSMTPGQYRHLQH